VARRNFRQLRPGDKISLARGAISSPYRRDRQPRRSGKCQEGQAACLPHCSLQNLFGRLQIGLRGGRDIPPDARSCLPSSSDSDSCNPPKRFWSGTVRVSGWTYSLPVLLGTCHSGGGVRRIRTDCWRLSYGGSLIYGLRLAETPAGRESLTPPASKGTPCKGARDCCHIPNRWLHPWPPRSLVGAHHSRLCQRSYQFLHHLSHMSYLRVWWWTGSRRCYVSWGFRFAVILW